MFKKKKHVYIWDPKGTWWWEEKLSMLLRSLAKNTVVDYTIVCLKKKKKTSCKLSGCFMYYSFNKWINSLSKLPLDNSEYKWVHRALTYFANNGTFLFLSLRRQESTFMSVHAWAHEERMARFLNPNIRKFLATQIRMSSDQVDI